MSDAYVYCWIRRDLPLVQQIIQLGHVAYEHALRLPIIHRNASEPSNFVLFEVADVDELTEIRKHLYLLIPNHWHIFYEDAIGEYTAIITDPISDIRTRNYFKNFKLYGVNDETTDTERPTSGISGE